MRTLLLCPLFAFALVASAADWPQFRGPNGSGLCPECGSLPAEFGPGKNVVWKTAVPAGKSSPVLAGDRIFLTAAEGDNLVTLCLNRLTGKMLWQRTVRAARRDHQNPLNHRAAPTAVTDGANSVFVFFADFGLVAYDFEGNPKWQLPLGPFNSQHGVVGSPVYADNRVILVCDADTDAFIMGVDARTGKVAWKAPRHVINGYSTPTIYRPAQGPTQVIAAGSYQLTAYSVADGEPLWFVGGLTCQPKSAPVIAGGVLYFNGWTTGNDAGEQVDLPQFPEVIAKADSNKDGKLAQTELPPPWQPTGTWRAIDLDRDGFLNEREWTFFRTRRASRNALLAVKLGGSGDVTDTHVLWRHEKSLPDVPTPLVYNNTVFLFRNGGIATTLNASTGAVIKQARLSGALEDYYASPVGVDGKVYVATEHGKMVVLRAAGDWEVLAINEFDSEIYATPAVSEGRMYVRTRDALYAVGQEPRFEELAALFENDPKQPFDDKLAPLPCREGVRLYDFSFASPAGGGRVPGVLAAPDRRGRFPVVLFGHWMMKGSPMRNRNEFVEEAVILARAGAICVLLDSPLVRDGVVEDPDPEHGQGALAGVQMAREWRRALDIALARPDADPARVAYVGHSFNAGVGAKLAGVEKRIKAFVLMANMYSLRDLVYDPENEEMVAFRKKVGDGLLETYFRNFPFDDSAPFAKRSAPAAVFLQNGRLDKPLPERIVRVSHALFGEPKRLEFYDAGHELNAAARADRVRWLAERLGLTGIDYKALDAIPHLQ